MQNTDAELEAVIMEFTGEQGLSVRRLSFEEADALKKAKRAKGLDRLMRARLDGSFQRVQQEIQSKNDMLGVMKILDRRPIAFRQ